MSYIPSQVPYAPTTSNQNMTPVYGSNQISGYPVYSSVNSYAPQYSSPLPVNSSQSNLLGTLVNVVSQLVNVVATLVNKLVGGSQETAGSSLPQTGAASYYGTNSLGTGYEMPGSGVINNSSDLLGQLSSLWDFGIQAFSTIGKKASGIWSGVKSFVSGLF